MMNEMDRLLKLLHEIYKDGYVQGRQDGLEGIHIEPQLVLNDYLNDENVYLKLFELGVLKAPSTEENSANIH